MKSVRPPVGWWALLLAATAVCATTPLAAQSLPAWSPSHSLLGARGVSPDSAGGPLGTAAVAQSLSRNTLSGPLLNPAAPALGAELQLQQAVRAAVAWQPVVAAAVAQLRQQGSTVEQMQAGYAPAFSAGLQTGRQSATSRGAAFSINASQMLYDFGKVSSQVGEAQAGVYRAQAEVLRQIDNVATQTALAVVELARYQALEAIAQDQLGALRDVVRVTDLRARLGASTRVDPVQARARLEAAEVYAQQLQTQARQWRARLKTLLGVEVPERVAALPADHLLRATAPLAEPPVPPSVLVAAADKQALQARLEGARAARLPTLSLEGTLTRLGSGAAGGRSTDHGVFFKLSSGVFQGGAQQAQEDAARMAVQSAEARVDVARTESLDRQANLREQVAGLQAVAAPLAQRQLSITETRALYREQYLALGSRSALDLLNAEQEIAQAAFDVVQNRHDTWAAMVNLIDVSGRARDVYGLIDTRIHGLEIQP